MTLSRRTWLWTSTAALAAACTRPGPTRLPEAGAEGPRELTRRGAENLSALAELGAAIRWLHPSDGAAQVEWEPLLLDGVRELEGAGTREELVEGLRGLFGEVAPTVVIWRRELREGDDLDERACPDPEDPSKSDTTEASDAKAGAGGVDGASSDDSKSTKSKSGDVAPTSDPPSGDVESGESKSDGSQPDDAKASDPKSDDADSKSNDPKSEDAEPDAKLGRGGSNGDATASDSKSEDAETDESNAVGTTEPGDATPADAESREPKSREPKPSDAKPRDQSPRRPDQPADAKAEDRPPLPAELFAADEPRSTIQWHHRGYAEPAQRIVYLPESDRPCPVTQPRRSKAECDELPEARALAPAAPLRIELPRGLSSLVPLALWLRDDRSTASHPASFGESEALEYSLADRGARLLAVLRTWSLLRQFAPHPPADQRALIPALCTAAEDPSPDALHEALETLLAGFGDGNAALIREPGKPARRFVPALSLDWIEERVVVTGTAIEEVEPGDVITAIDGVSIDERLAERLPRTPASSASAAIVRTVASLLERERDGATIELTLARSEDQGERELSVRVRSDRRAPLLADARPSKPIVELAEGVVYVDATRVRRLAGAARRLRRADFVIVDLRGDLADPRGSLLARFLAESQTIAVERMPTGPDPAGRLPLELAGKRRVEPERPRLHATLLILADARTRGRAELELCGFDRLGATVIGSASAGDLGGVATAWLPGGWQLRFTHSELRAPDGSRLFGLGVRPSVPIAPTRASVRARLDPLLAAALELAGRS